MAAPPVPRQAGPRQPPPRQSGRAGRKSGKGGLIIAVVLLVAIGAVMASTTAVLLLGMIPTVVATIVDRDEDKLAAMTVGALNASGVIPYLLDLWRDGSLMGVLGDPMAWLVMYGAAAIGWGVHFGIPPMIAAVIAYRNDQRIADLRKVQLALVEEWGSEVAGDAVEPTQKQGPVSAAPVPAPVKAT